MSETSDRPVTGLRLDARQRAMLDEMGVKVWWPAQRVPRPTDATDTAGPGDGASDAAGAAETADTVRAGVHPQGAPPAAAPVPAVRASLGTVAAPSPSPVAVPRATPAPAPAVTRVPEAGPAPSARSASTSTSRGVPGVAFESPLRLYTVLDEDGIAAPPQGGWLVVADLPSGADDDPAEPFAGEAGRLLDNMLRALRLHDGRVPVHLMRTRRATPSGREAAGPSAGTDFVALAGALAPRIVLALGPLAAQSLLQSTEPLGRLRGRAEPLRIAPGGPLDGVPVVVTYPPAYLLRNPADKARAWADLCLAAERSETPPA